LLKWRVGTGSTEARVAEGNISYCGLRDSSARCFLAAGVQLTTWQLLVSMVAIASLGFQLLVLSFLCRILHQKKDC